MAFAAPSSREDIPTDPATLIRRGVIASVDLAAARCTINYGDPDDDDDLESPPLRWIMPRSGQTSIWSPPSVGEQALLICPDGQLSAGLILVGITCDAFPPAGNSPEELIRYPDGAEIAYDPESHVLRAILPAGAEARITAETIRITGNVEVTGDITVTGKVTATDDVLAAGKSLKSHKHTGVQAGGAQTGAPA